MKENIRVLIVDDSPTVRAILVAMLEDTPGIKVVGQARDGEEAVQLNTTLRPDVITMDIRMPHMNGLEATRQIMTSEPTPIVVVATSIYDSDMRIAFNAVAAGALTVVEKPNGLLPADFEAVRTQLVTAIRLMSDIQVVPLWPGGSPLEADLTPPPATHPTAGRFHIQMVAIAASTGGPGTLNQILHDLPADFPIPIVVVQHITRGFAQGFARWLDGLTPLQVNLARDGDRIAPGQVVIAPDDMHLTIVPGGIIRLDQSPPVQGLRPSATRLFESVARAYGPRALGIVLSGMGEDGVEGLAALHHVGGHIIAQNEESCVVFGMPKVAIERGVVDEILSPPDMTRLLRGLNGRNH